jgi:AraC-like DNA-binding protein
MVTTLSTSGGVGLEGSCGDWVRSVGPVGGIELLQAHFAGRGFSPHRHDTYGIGVTDFGVQTFDYRGSVERSLAGQVTVLHPDEKHDGRAGTDGGFGYRIVYVAPAEIGEALRAITRKATPLPFVNEPVAADARVARAVAEAFAADIGESLARDSLIAQLAQGLLRADASLARTTRPLQVDQRAVARAREYLDGQTGGVGSAELERATGLSRYELARQFRLSYGTSPYRYSVLRRLERARRRIRAGDPLAQVALDSGFADQAHFTRTFHANFGMPPGRYAALHAAGGA